MNGAENTINECARDGLLKFRIGGVRSIAGEIVYNCGPLGRQSELIIE